MKPALISLNIVLFLLFFFNQKSFSQDTIILTSGDTITCSINKITRKHVFYSQDYNGLSAKGKILKDRISEWSYVAAQKEPQAELFPPGWGNAEPLRTNEPDKMNVTRERIRISANGGPGYLLGNTEKAIEALQAKGVSTEHSNNYYDNLVSGNQVKSSFYIHAFGDYWIGALYNGFYTTSNITTPMQLDDVYMYFGKMEESFFVNFAGPSLFSVTRYGKSQKFGINTSITIGPAFYRNEYEMLNSQMLVQGKSLATNLTLGIEYFIQPQFSLSLESALFSSKLKKLAVNDGQTTNDVQLEKENYENLGRLDLSLGLIFYW